MSEPVNRYYDLARSRSLSNSGNHRQLVGGFWDEIGTLQFNFLKDEGLKPDMFLLDVGCGCLRGGVHFVEYLEPSHYFGTDISQDLLDAGYDIELGGLMLQHKLPRKNLVADGDFNFRQFGIEFDAAIAISLFTHLPLNHIRLCLTRLAEVVRTDGRFYATIFHCPDDHDWSQPLEHLPATTITQPASDPYHYRTSDILHCAAGLPWGVDIIGDWNHPRFQSMVRFLRTKTPL